MSRVRILALVVGAVALNVYGQTWKPSQTDNNVLQIAVLFGTPSPRIQPYGTGFFVRSDGLIATAGHVYLAAMSGIVDAHAGILIGRRFSREAHEKSVATPLDLVSQDYSHDVALLKLHTTDPNWNDVGGIVPVALEHSSKLEDDSRVGMRGYFGSDALPIFVEGKICGTAEMAPGAVELLIVLPAVPGYSGSPLFSMETGGVVGIVTSIVPVALPFNPQQPAHSGITRAVEVEHLNRLVEALSK